MRRFKEKEAENAKNAANAAKYRKECSTLKQKVEKMRSCENPSAEKKKSKKIEIIGVDTIDSLEKIKKLGRGATSEVFEVIRKERLALKQLDVEMCFKINEQKDQNTKNEEEEEEEYEEDDQININVDLLKHFLLEYEAVNNLDHENIVRTFGFCFGDRKHAPSILLEFCPNNLKKKVKKLNIQTRSRIVSELVSAMEKVHSAG